MPIQTMILAWGCLALGAGLAGYALHSIREGKTRGYYDEHQYRSGEGGVRFDVWVWFRLLLGVGCLIFGIIAL